VEMRSSPRTDCIFPQPICPTGSRRETPSISSAKYFALSETLRSALPDALRHSSRWNAFKQDRAFGAPRIGHIRHSNSAIFEIQIMPAAQTFLSPQG
jgi:hypothetical protein